MSEVSFYGTVDKWTLGEPPRLEIVSRTRDNAVAQSLALLRQRILSVSVYEGAKDDEFCTLTATLPQIQSSVAKSGDGTRVKLDVDPAQLPIILRLLAIADKALRFAFADEGTVPGKVKREPKPPKQPTPYGKFWQEMDKSGFHNRPDVRQWIDYYEADEAEAKELIRRMLGVEKRSLEASPEMLVAAMLAWDTLLMHSAITAVERATAAVRDREGV